MRDRKRTGPMRFEDEPERPRRSRGRSGRDDFDEGDDRGDADDGDDDEEDDDPRPRRRISSSRRREPERGRRDGGSGRSRRTTRDDEDDDFGGADEEFGHGQRARSKRTKQSLLNLCTPLFGYAAVLPKDAGDTHPAYATFRNEVLTALQRVEKDAPDHDIDRDDATEATYALSCFLDEQVAGSHWTGKGQWAAEPLGIVRHQDPDGGINFYRRLDALSSRQNAAKEVYLVCLAFGFKGKYGEFDPSQQVAQLGEIRQRILRDINPTEMERLRVLFPTGYEPALPVESQGPESKPWWLWASFAVVIAAIAVWFVLFLSAGPPKDAMDKLRSVSRVLAATSWEAPV